MMLKRKDGSYSKKGLYDNIRKKAAENKAAGKAGKKPTNEMLKQDAKIKENMKSKSNSKSPSKKMGGGYKAPQYQMGGDMIEPSKEVMFGNPPMMRGGGKSKPDYLDIDKDGNKTEPMKTAASKTKMMGGGIKGKSIKAGGGSKFAKLVNKLKGEGKSENSANAIAASIGREKYGKTKFQQMANK
jgi:hypothetical protein